MKNQTFLLVMNTATPDAEILQLTEGASARNARVICLVLSMAPAYPLSAYSAIPYGGVELADGWLEQVNETKKELRSRADAVEALLRREGISGGVHPVQCVLGDVPQVVGQRGLVCDFATVAPSLRKSDPALYRSATHAILFDAPIALRQNGSPLSQPRTVLVAWNGERPASQALHAALPLLKSAKDIQIAVFDPSARESEDGEEPGSDVAEWLSHHGCEVTVNQFPSGGEEIGECIRRRAAELGADLVVMGAYGRSRIREFVFGGTTRTMLDQTEIPVLLAH